MLIKISPLCTRTDICYSYSRVLALGQPFGFNQNHHRLPTHHPSIVTTTTTTGLDIGFMKIPENSARKNFGGIIPDFREHFFGNFGFPDLEAL